MCNIHTATYIQQGINEKRDASSTAFPEVHDGWAGIRGRGERRSIPRGWSSFREIMRP